MKNLISHLKPVHWLLAKFGYTIGGINERYPKVSRDYEDIYKIVRPYTMCWENVVYTALRVVDALVVQQHNNKHLRLIQCGTWRGGLAGAVALRLKYHQRLGNLQTFHIHIMDTFEGMPRPTDEDAPGDLKVWKERRGRDDRSDWCYASLEEVKGNLKRILRTTELSGHEFSFWRGKVEDRLPDLVECEDVQCGFHFVMLDTDFYTSTRAELEHLFPLLNFEGFLLIDDYGGLEGCKKAVDEYWNQEERLEFLFPVDMTARLVQKLPINPDWAKAAHIIPNPN